LKNLAEPIDLPPADGQSRQFSEKINQIVDHIANLTLLEVADLNQALKVPILCLHLFPIRQICNFFTFQKRLNLPDAPVMSFGAVAQAAAPAKVI